MKHFKINEQGPYGISEHGTILAIDNYLTQEFGFTEEEISCLKYQEGVAVDKLDGSVFRYAWFSGIDYPCILSVNPKYTKRLNPNKINIVDGQAIPDFRVTLTSHIMPGFEVDGGYATPELHEFLKGMLTNWMDDPRYLIHKEAGAFFQGGYNSPDDKWFMIEFWNPKGAQAFVDYVNEHYRPGVKLCTD